MKKICVLLFLVGLVSVLFAQNADLCLKDIDLVINDNCCLQGSFYDESDGGLQLRAELCVLNSNVNEIVFSSGSDVVGAQLCFKGSANSFLEGNGLNFESLELGMSGADLYLNGGLSLCSRLLLFSGRVLDDGAGSIKLTDPSETSLIFNNVKNNSSYLAATLSRAVLPGREYYYPVGDEVSYHPFVASEFEAANQVSLSYSSSLDEQWADVTGNADVRFPFSGAWVVEDDGLGASFMARMSKLDKEANVVEGSMDALYATNPPAFFEDPIFERSLLETDGYFLSTTQKQGTGMYSLIESNYGLTPEKDDIELVNTIVVDQTSETYFIVPEAEKYQRIEIAVYDSWGRVIFTSNEYVNDFNCRDYPSGTYYYHMNAVLLDGSKIVKDDIIEVVRKD
jgi:hypothetical protein